MSWDGYITNMQTSGAQICGIYGLQGGAWAQSSGFSVSQAEILNIVKGIKGQSFPEGVHLGGTKYMMVRVSSDTVTGKRKGTDDSYLVHIALTNTAVVVGGASGAAERNCTKVVEDIRDYLTKSGY